MDEPVRVLSTLALKGAVSHLAGHYVAAGGARIEADFAPTLALLDRLRAGEAADVVILTREGLDEVVREGRVTAASCVDLARSYVGLAVRAGEPHPDISTEPGLRAALLGAHAVIIPQGFTAERLAAGEADLAVQQISELKQVGGIEVIGPIPHQLQTAAVFSAGCMAASPRAAQSDRLLRYLASPEVAAALRESGLEP
jgi:molybdate transport system substrate-binding protein